MARRPRIADVAQAAGVSVATVDRVLNGRLPVREETARRVYEAASGIGYHATGLIRQRIYEDLPQVKLGFLFQKPGQAFYQAFTAEAEAAALAAQGVRATPLVGYTAAQTPAALVEALQAMAARGAQAIAMVSPDHPAVTAEVASLKDRGIPVFSLLSDFASGMRENYVGLDNRKVGRTAAWMIARAARRPGKVAVFVGSHRFHGHELREIGFRSYFRENAPEFSMLDTLVNLDTRQLTHEATLDLLHRHPDLVGLYVAGGGMEGAIAALREEQTGERIVFVCNEITPDSRAGLADGIVTMAIATPLATLCRDLVSAMLRTLRDGMAETPGQTFLPFDIHLPETI
jgi:LacI family transcriptional regulator